MAPRRVRIVALLVTIAIACAVTACGSGVSTTERTQQQSASEAEASLRDRGFTKVTLRVRAADGTVQEHCVWLADSDLERQRGLVQISDESLGGAGAMVFTFESDSSATFWMKEAVVPLSVAWFDGAGSFLGSADMEPCVGGADCPRYPGPRPFRLAVEMVRGGLADWGIGPGATVSVADSC